MYKKMADNEIRVAVMLRNSFAALRYLGVPFSVCLQLQLSNLKLAEAHWTAGIDEFRFIDQLLLASGVTSRC
jgi:hypothetical protein